MKQPFQDIFSASPALFPHMLDIPSDTILVSELSEEAYRAASFLDQRILTQQLRRQTVPWGALETISLPSKPLPYYIFHIGHVGSTLMSRLLGERPEIFALREPHILRSFAELSQIRGLPQSIWSPETYQSRLATATMWLSRTFNPESRAMIKASSFASELAKELLLADTKAMFLFVPLERYIETILAGAGSRQEAKQLAQARILRLNRRLGQSVGNLWELPEAHVIALGWMCEMTTLIDAAQVSDSQKIYWQNFESFLQSPAPSLSRITEHFGLNANLEDCAKLAESPIMRSYSKAPEYDYSADLRQQLLEQARKEHGGAINAAIKWVVDLSKNHALIEAALNQTGKR